MFYSECSLRQNIFFLFLFFLIYASLSSYSFSFGKIYGFLLLFFFPLFLFSYVFFFFLLLSILPSFSALCSSPNFLFFFCHKSNMFSSVFLLPCLFLSPAVLRLLKSISFLPPPPFLSRLQLLQICFVFI